MATGVGQEDATNPIFNGIEKVVGSDVVTNAVNAFKDAVNSIPAPETKKQGAAHKAIQKGYGYEFLQYPQDLATGTRHPYWMTFYINTQDLSHYKRPPSKGPEPLSTVDINARQSRNLNKNFGKTNVGFGRKTHRTSMAIRLYMPDTLSWSFRNNFREANLSGVMGTGIAHTLVSLPSFADSQAQHHKKGGIAGILASLDSPAGRNELGVGAEVIGGLIPGAGEDLGLQLLGLSVNPQVDVLYQSPGLRDFNFDFLFAPRNQTEAQQVSEIIKMFKFHAAPELLANGTLGLGRYFVPPSEFDIEFSVTSMGKISTCVLQSITVDYAPSGAAFYGVDQRPVNTRLVLQFKELEFITKELVEQGY